MTEIYRSGTLIGNRYVVVQGPHEKPGLAGGMGIVYLCEDLKEDRPVALKTFRPEYRPDRAARDRFLREGTAWVDLGAHPHIVRCYQVIHLDLEVYLVVELVAKEQGREDASLRSWLAPGHPLPVETALLFALQIARALKHATAVIPGFVHRDLKPENVLVGADRLTGTHVKRLRVTDFGLAAVLQAGDQGTGSREQDTSPSGQGSQVTDPLRRTQLTRGIAGTPLYMAPEQWWGEGVSVATDVYALGCMLYEMVAGQRAVSGDSVAALERAHCAGERRAWPAGVAGAVREVVGRCLAVEARERYGSWEEVEGALGEVYRAVLGRPAPPVQVAAALSRGERVAAGWSYSVMGTSYLDIGKAEVAAGYFERAVGVGRAEEEQELEGAALGNLGVAYKDLGDARRAIGCHEQRLEIAREIGDRYGEGIALGNLGNVYLQLGDARRAIGYHEQASAIDREIGDRRGEGAALGNLGLAYAGLGDTRRAIGYHEQCLTITREFGDRRGEGNALGNLGNAYLQLGDARRAIGYYEQQLVITCEIGDRRGEGNALGNLGNVYLQLGDARRAIGYHRQALRISQEIGDVLTAAMLSANLAMSLAQTGQANEALPLIEQAVRDFRQAGYPQQAQQAEQMLAQIRAALR